MNLCDPSVHDPRYDELEDRFIRVRNERSKLVMTSSATAEVLHRLEEEEMRALWAILDYKLAVRVALLP